MNRLILLPLSCAFLCGCAEGPAPAALDKATNADATAVAETVLPETSTAELAADATETEKEEVMPAEPAPAEYNELTDFEKYVILEKGTERRFVGEYTDTKDPGTYICRRCNAPLYKSEHKFSSHCGWPSFDDEIAGAVEKTPDEDGERTEITCKACGGHLGHVFDGEGYTAKNTRHCVNSVSMKFIAEGKPLPPVVQKPAVSEPPTGATPKAP
jgi:methionine-R-sulfoxide reductase